MFRLNPQQLETTTGVCTQQQSWCPTCTSKHNDLHCLNNTWMHTFSFCPVNFTDETPPAVTSELWFSILWVVTVTFLSWDQQPLWHDPYVTCPLCDIQTYRHTDIQMNLKPPRVCALNSKAGALSTHIQQIAPFEQHMDAHFLVLPHKLLQMKHCWQWHQSSDFLPSELPLWHSSYWICNHWDMTLVWHAPYVTDRQIDRQTDSQPARQTDE